MKLLDKIFIYGTYTLTILSWIAVFFMGMGMFLPILITILSFLMYRYQKTL